MINRICSLPDCGKPHDSRGLCKRHASRALRTGALPLKENHGPVGESLKDRLYRIGWDVTPSDCWEWRGSRIRGYGVMQGVGATRRSHRVSHEVHIGPIPPGMVVMHTCDNPPCVNPDHLTLGTQADNLADMYAKGRANLRGLALGRLPRAQ